MRYENVKRLRDALVGKTITSVETHGGHGMVLQLIVSDPHVPSWIRKIDICTYDDGREHDVDEFYVALDGTEL